MTVIHHDGRYLPADQATVPVTALVLRYGLSVFEGIRAYALADGSLRPFMMDAHLDRMRAGLDMIGFPDPGIDGIPDIAAELIDRNGIDTDCYIRPSVSAVNIGDLQDDPQPGLTVTVKPMGRKKWLAQGLAMRACFAQLTRIPGAAFPSNLKCIGAYVPGYIETRRAKAAGYDIPILTTARGHVSEGPTAAIAMIKDNALIRPDPGDDMLPSITMDVVSEVAGGLGLARQFAHISRADLLAADEVFFCGTGLEIAGVGEVDGRQIGAAATGRRWLPALVDGYFGRVRAPARSSEVTA